jgi:hypothetical protein
MVSGLFDEVLLGEILTVILLFGVVVCRWMFAAWRCGRLACYINSRAACQSVTPSLPVWSVFIPKRSGITVPVSSWATLWLDCGATLPWPLSSQLLGGGSATAERACWRVADSRLHQLQFGRSVPLFGARWFVCVCKSTVSATISSRIVCNGTSALYR